MHLGKGLILTISAAAMLGWAPTSFAGPSPGGGVFAADFNGDGKDDIALEGAADVEVRHLDGVSTVSTGSFPNGGGGFALKAVGYLNAGDNADIVQQGAGTIVVRLSNAGGTAQSSAIFFGDGGGAWNVVAACDVNGDGVDEVIAEGTGGALGAVRISDISSGSPSHSFISTAGGIWQFQFCVDANGDGNQDLYFVADGGATARANLAGTATAVFHALGGGVWSPVAAGNTTGSGSDAIADTGTGAATGFVRVRTLDSNGDVSGSGFVPNGGGTQALVFMGDFNNDGRADLAFRSGASNRLALIDADGRNSSASTFPGTAGGAAVLDQGANTNGDGAVDLISVLSGNVFVQTIDETSSLVSNANTLTTAPRVLFTANF